MPYLASLDTNMKPFSLRRYIPRFVIAPSILMSALFVYGFMLFTFYLSFTSSTILPRLDWIGAENYKTLFTLQNWIIAIKNLGIFSAFYIVFSLLLGLILAIFVNQRVVGENAFRSIYLYPMAISFIVTGTAWKWILDPGVGIERIIKSLGWEAFKFDWIKNSDFAIYCVIIAAVWQASGFVMAIFLAGLRDINQEHLESASIDGANAFTVYTRIIIPQLSPAFLSAIVILGHLVIKSYDLIIALTNGGPGRATEMPSTFMYSYTFTRNQMSIGATAAVIMLLAIGIIISPYLRSELQRGE